MQGAATLWLAITLACAGQGLFISSLHAQEETTVRGSRPLKVGLHIAPPFVMKSPAGEWTGITIDLWHEIAKARNLNFEFVELSLEELLKQTESGEIDLATAALTITPERAQRVDFTHPYFDSGLSIASRPRHAQGILMFALRVIFSAEFRTVILGLLPLLAASGFLMWLVERRANPKHFGGSLLEGTGKGVWWSAVTMTTVGYGDKAPVTLIGRSIAFFWMFTCLVLVSSFTGAVASLMTVENLDTVMISETDLSKVKVGTVKASSGERYLRRVRVVPETFQTLTAALTELADGNLDAVVYDRPILQYYAANQFEDKIQVMPYSFTFEEYGFALPVGNKLRKTINLELLRFMRGDRWEEIQIRHLGTAGREIIP